jgi:hypothetical protein
LLAGGQKDLIFGRYIEPIIPISVIIGIICISNIDQKIVNKKNIIYFTLISIPVILIMPYIFAWDNVILNVFNDLQDNPTLYAYTIFYGYSTLNAFTIFYEPNFSIQAQTISSYLLPSSLMSIYFSAIIALITLSMKNKRYISLLLVFLIMSSLIFSSTLYHVSVAKSNDADNSIARFLSNNTNDKTIYLIDLATTPANVNIEKYIYGFWNKGDIDYSNGEKISLKDTGLHKTMYLISTKSFSYNKVANDGNFTLYRVV